jgi:hypothetical protein
LLTIVTKWRHYFMGSPFVIKTDQIDIKKLLEQRVNTIIQHKGSSKLLKLDYTIVYKRGVDNKVVVAFFKREGKTINILFCRVNYKKCQKSFPNR